jgi:hypothetical protein
MDYRGWVSDPSQRTQLRDGHSTTLTGCTSTHQKNPTQNSAVTDTFIQRNNQPVRRHFLFSLLFASFQGFSHLPASTLLSRHFLFSNTSETAQRGSIPGNGNIQFSSSDVRTGSGAHPEAYSVCVGSTQHGGGRGGGGVNSRNTNLTSQSPPSSA